MIYKFVIPMLIALSRAKKIGDLFPQFPTKWKGAVPIVAAINVISRAGSEDEKRAFLKHSPIYSAPAYAP